MIETSKPEIHDFADAEHCVLEDATIEHPKILPDVAGGRAPEQVREEIVIRDFLRRRQTVVKIYEEGWIDIETGRRGKTPERHRVNLRYIDAVPTMERYYALKRLKISGVTAAAATIIAIPAFLGWFPIYTVPTAIVAAAATVYGLWTSFTRSQEQIVFQTLHGRAGAIRLIAGLGTIRRFHRLVPKLIEAIADAAESVHEETAIYLRAEMREHYRLCNEGVLSDEECAVSTGRILKSFGGQQ